MTPYHHRRPYSPTGPLAYLISWRCYGTWLHGSTKGSMDRRTWNTYGAPKIVSSADRRAWERRQMKQPVQRLSPAQRAVVDRTVREVLTHNGWQLHSLRVMTEHVHVVLSAAKKPDEVMDSLKSWCTRRLREEGLLESTIRPWSRHGSTRYLWDEEAVRDACAYVEAHG